MLKNILISLAILAGGCLQAEAASPSFVLEVAPNTNSPVDTYSASQSTCAVGSVTVSSSVITRVDNTFNAAVLAAWGNVYQRAEVTTQNNSSLNVYCGYSTSGVTTSNSFLLLPGSVWTWKLGKTQGVYCLAAAGASGTLIVGGIAWK
jgi:hypothetical protein